MEKNNQAKLATAVYEIIYSVHFVGLESKVFTHKECFFHDVVYDFKASNITMQTKTSQNWNKVLLLSYC